MNNKCAAFFIIYFTVYSHHLQNIKIEKFSFGSIPFSLYIYLNYVFYNPIQFLLPTIDIKFFQLILTLIGCTLSSKEAWKSFSNSCGLL